MFKSIFILVSMTLSLSTYSMCLQTMNIYGVWSTKDLFKTKLKERNQNLLRALKSEPICDYLFFQEVWSDTSVNILRKYSSEVTVEKIKNINESRYNTGLAYASTQTKLANKEAYTFYRNAPGKDGRIRDLPFVKIKKGFQYLKLPEGINIINTHLQPMGGNATTEELKLTQLSHVIDLVHFLLIEKQAENEPLVLLGDFNNFPGSMTFNLLFDVLLLKDSYLEINNKYPPSSCTYCGQYFLNSRIIDYILVKNGANKKMKLNSAKINLSSKKGNFISDHSGVRLNLELVSLKNSNIKLSTSRLNKAINTLKAAAKLFKKNKSFSREVEITEVLIKALTQEARLKNFYSIID